MKECINPSTCGKWVTIRLHNGNSIEGNISLPELLDQSWNLDLTKNRQKLVVFEGGDKVGKSTLFQLFRRATHYIPLAIDRFTGSNWVYDQIYGRTTELFNYITLEERMDELYDCYLVVLVSDPEVQEKRIEDSEAGKDAIIARRNFKEAGELFEKYFFTSHYTNCIMIDTSEMSIEETLKEILEFVKEEDLRGETETGKQDTESL